MRLFALAALGMVPSLGAFAQKSTPPPEHLVSGIIQFEAGAASGGELYVTVTPEGAESIKVEKPDPKPTDKKKAEQLPETNGNQFLNLGRNSGKTATFSLNLKRGRYRLGCLVKISDPPCSGYRINNGRTVTACLPGPKDILCADLNIEVENSSMQNLTLKAGLPLK